MTPQRRATMVASATALFLICIKLVVGFMTGTVVIIASAIDSMLDFVVSLFNYWAVRESERPSDSQFNYGRGKIEAIASVFEGTIVTLSGFFIIYAAVSKLNTHAVTTKIDLSLWVMAASSIVTFLLVLYLNKTAKATGSMVLQADALHYKTDLYTNAGIMVSLGLIAATGLDMIDPIVSIIIAVYIIGSAYGIIKEGLSVLMDKALDEETVAKIEDIVTSTSPRVHSYHHLRTRSAGTMFFVECHVVFDDKILLAEAHYIGDVIEDKIRHIDPDAKWVINIHLDPRDDSMKDFI